MCHVSHPLLAPDRPTGRHGEREKGKISIGSQSVVGYGMHLSGGSSMSGRSAVSPSQPIFSFPQQWGFFVCEVSLFVFVGRCRQRGRSSGCAQLAPSRRGSTWERASRRTQLLTKK